MWLGLTGVWTVWLVFALAGGSFLTGALGVLRIVPVLLFMLPAPWVRLAARPEGLEVVHTFSRQLVPWEQIIGVAATDAGIEIRRVTGEVVRWLAVERSIWRRSPRWRGYAERIAGALNAELSRRRPAGVEDPAADPPASRTPPPNLPHPTSVSAAMPSALSCSPPGSRPWWWSTPSGSPSVDDPKARAGSSPSAEPVLDGGRRLHASQHEATQCVL